MQLIWNGQGQFYIQVGNDEYFELGQSAWSGAPYIPSNTTKKIVDNSITFISNIGDTIKKVDEGVQKNKAIIEGEQLTKIVKYIDDMAKKEKIKNKQLWLDPIPENIFIKDIRGKYKKNEETNIINPVIGEYDDPTSQKQDIATVNFNEVGNTLIFGNADSGKESLLTTLIYDLIDNYTPNEISLYILDFGSESLKIYQKAPQVGDIVFINEKEKIERFFEMILQEIKIRKDLLSQYNGDYNLYINQTGKSMPMIMIIINNYAMISEIYDMKYDDIFSSLTRDGLKYRIVFVMTLTSTNDMRYRLKQNFRQNIVLQLNKDDEYISISTKIRKLRPSSLFGRGLIEIDDNYYEFQTAKICDIEQYNNEISEKIDELNEKYKEKAKEIPILPDVVTFEKLKPRLNAISSVPLGITKKDIRIFNYDFKDNFATIIAGKSMDEVVEYTKNIIYELQELKNIELTILDGENALSEQSTNLNEKYEKFINTAKESNEKKHQVCVIIGVDKFVSQLIDKRSLATNMEELSTRKKCSFIIADNLSDFKNHTLDDWYRRYIKNDCGIWVGNGYMEQMLIKSEYNRKEIENNCGLTFGYVVLKGRPIEIKLLEMKEKEEDKFGE